MVECIKPKLDLCDVLKDFGPKQQQIWENSMLHPSITAVISALVSQVRSQNEVINKLVNSKTQKEDGGERERERERERKSSGSGKDSDDDLEGYVKQRVQNIEETLWGSEAETKDVTSVSGEHASEEVTRRLERIETQLENKIDLSVLEDHKRKTSLLLKRYHEKQSELSNSDDNRAEIARMAAEVLSVASSATESISESISSDYQYMVKSLEVVRSDLTFVVENLYGLKNLGSSRVVISPSRNRTGFSKDEVDIEEMSKRLRSAILATTSSSGGKKAAKGSLVVDTRALHEKMKAVLDLLDRQQGRTTDLEDKFRVSENILSDHEERITRVALELPSSTSPSRGFGLYENDMEGTDSPTTSGMSTPNYRSTPNKIGKAGTRDAAAVDDEVGKIFKLQLKDMHSRIDAVVAQVESATALNKKPTSVKAINQKLDKMEDRIDALGSQIAVVKKDQDAFKRKVTLVDDKHRKVASEKVKTLANQVTKHSEAHKMVELRVDSLEKDMQAKLKQCKIDVATLKKHYSDRPGLRESSTAELVSKVRLLEAQVEDVKLSLESSKKRSTKYINDKIKGLSDQTAMQFETMQDIPAKLLKLEAKSKEGTDLSSKKFLSKVQAKSFITAEVKVLKEYIESRWNDIADQLKESIQITKESIRSSKPAAPETSGENHTEPKTKSVSEGKLKRLEILANTLQNELACQSETQKEIQMRLFGLEGKCEAANRSLPSQRGDSALYSDVMKWKNLIDQQYNKLADQVEDYIADSKTGLKAASAIEERLENVILFLQEKLKPEELAKIVKQHYAPDGNEIEKKLTAFHRTVLKMANFDDICVSEIASLTNRMQVVEAKSSPAAVYNDFQERLNSKADLAMVMDLNKSLKDELVHALENKVDWKIFLASTSKSPYKHKVQL